MGAWEAGNFDNDTAMDWVGSLLESGNASTVHTTLSLAAKSIVPKQPSFLGKMLGCSPAEPNLDASAATEALAAAEIVACWLGHALPEIPNGLADWVQKHSSEFSSDSVQLARQAVTTIKTKSELKDLWEEGDATVASEWHKVITDLERRLQN